MVNPYDVIMLPWITEKAMEARTSGNRLEFIVRRSATSLKSQKRLRNYSMLKLTRSMSAIPRTES